MKKKRMEILSPAGSVESLIAAVRAGADAVYLGASSFSARANAKNFDREQLREAVEYCHIRNVKVYLAVNTLLKQEELGEALKLVEYACSLPVDALIVQDLGLIYLLRQCAPSMKRNASTQMSVHTPEGVHLLAKQGFSRVVLARELSLKEIEEIYKKNQSMQIELEAFVHGALCMSVSGQCYFSAMLGSRSGNRGLCAQTCRLPFSVPDGTGHDLSLKDLSMILRLGELSSAGICSAKIEGRMKRPEYVAAATAACRYAAQGQEVPEDLLKNLSAVFSRSGFTTGYPDGKLGREMFGVRSKEDVTGATNAVFSQLHQIYQKETPRIALQAFFRVEKGKPAILEVMDKDGHNVRLESNEIPQKAVKGALTVENCEEQLKKTGGTPFYFEKISFAIQEELALPVSELNRMRRESLQKIEQQRAQRPAIPFHFCEIPNQPHHAKKQMAIRARFFRAETLPVEAKQCELVFLPLSTSIDRFESLLKQGFPVAVDLPRGMFGREKQIQQKMSALAELGITDCRAGNIGAVALGLKLGQRVHGAFSLNIMNTAAIAWCEDLGITDVELSFELTLSQAEKVGGKLPRGLLLYGRLPLMLCRNCPAANSPQGCRNCKEVPVLRDRRGIEFPIQCDGGCSEILNSVPLDMSDKLCGIRGQDFAVLNFTVENSVESGEILRRYFSPISSKSPLKSFTRGLYFRGVE